jgi:hypothetical protein
MRLKRDTLGEWPNVQDSVQGDLTTVQRALDDLQAQILAATNRITTVEGKVTSRGPIIPVTGNVSTFTKKDGSPTIPFGGATPVPPVVTPDVLVANIANVPFIGLATTPGTLIPGVAGKVIVPIMCAYEFTCGPGVNYTNGNTGAKLCINLAANPVMTLNGFQLLTSNTRFYIVGTVSSWNTAAPVGVNEHFVGKPLKLTTTANISDPGGAGPAVINMSIAYYLAGLTLFS